MPGCTFQESWRTDPVLNVWLKRGKTPNHAYCKLCDSTIDLTSMGKTAVKSHSEGKKHKQRVSNSSQQHNIQNFFREQEHSTQSSSSAQSAPTCIASYVSKTETQTAEVLWALKMVSSNYSFHSQDECCTIFQRMFPDSDIAKSMTFGETKAMYLTCFGIAPYFSQLLEKKAKDQPYVLLFDESLNRELQKKQMDILIRIWDDNRVSSRYYKSDFLGHACAVDITTSFETNVATNLNYKNLLQVSMDGPNVNWAVFKQLSDKLEEDYDTAIVDIGSCGLHTMHNAVKAAVTETGWDLHKILSSLHTLFDDVPARRADYESCTGQSLYGVNFCAHRWVENVPACERAVEVYPHVAKYVAKVAKKEVKNPGTKSFDVIKDWTKDPFGIAKMTFIPFAVRHVNSFLTIYQTDAPMVPFMFDDLHNVLRSTMRCFVKADLIEKATTVEKLMKVDITSEANLKSLSKIDLGFSTDKELKNAQIKHKVSDRAILEFRSDCKKFFTTLTSKLKLKSPVNYKVVKRMRSLNPDRILHYTISFSKEEFKLLLDELVSRKKVQIETCDEILDQYENFAQDLRTSSSHKFNKDEDRLDEFYHSYFQNNVTFSKLWNVIKLVLLLSHGQATVERGFSINKAISTTNLSEHNLIARRIVKDHIKHTGGLDKVVITKELLTSASAGRRRYNSYLEEERLKNERKQKSTKRKAVEEDVNNLRKKKKQLEERAAFLVSDADRQSEKAETLQSFHLLSKANAIRRKAKEIEDELPEVIKQLQQKEKLLANL